MKIDSQSVKRFKKPYQMIHIKLIANKMLNKRGHKRRIHSQRNGLTTLGFIKIERIDRITCKITTALFSFAVRVKAF